MSTLRYFCISLVVLGLGLSKSEGQSSINSAGASITSNDGSVSFSLGQLAVNTLEGSGYGIFPGVQVPHEVSTEIDPGDLYVAQDLVLFPNPAYQSLSIAFNSYENAHHYDFEIVSITGEVVERGDIGARQTQLDISHLTPSVYLLRITRDGGKPIIRKLVKK